jgi:two-component sensor histidine kinase
VQNGQPRLLYIDDDQALCRLTQKAMERRGYAVATASDGVSGVALAAAETFDVIALDHYMPGQDGLATLAQLRALPSAPPIVYVTGSEETRIAVAALKAGAADYVVKSTQDDFSDLLQSALDQAVANIRLTRERDQAQQALSEANANLEAVVARQLVLLREVNHRVANSLQLIASLVHMQAGAVRDEGAQSALRDTQARISAIMQIHRRLYTSENVASVDMGDYLEGLVSELHQSLSSAHRNRPIRLTAEAVTMDADKAVSLGVIVAELVTNACKYAYGDDEDGEIRIALIHASPDTLRLTVEDDGRGFAHGVAPTGTGLGQKVISAMARSLETEMTFDPAYKGTRAIMTFPA